MHQNRKKPANNPMKPQDSTIIVHQKITRDIDFLLNTYRKKTRNIFLFNKLN